VLNVDASSKGLVAVILQDGKPVAFRSKTLTTCEKKYTNIERELLAIAWGRTEISHLRIRAQSNCRDRSQTLRVHLPKVSE